ncbi:MAG TPA: VOC family protein, partial [Accumulibacter sp.]|uniref:VOC family protein n=1 Tax=Accumulibacter sp. TaxID=2053492 RepID=UPI002C2A57FB
MNKENPVRWFEIYVQDMPRAKSFYAAVLGVEFTRLDSPGMEMWAFPMQMDAGGASG